MSLKIMNWINIVVVYFILNMLFILTTCLGFFFFGLIPSLMTVCKIIKMEGIFNQNYKFIWQLYFFEFKTCLSNETKIVLSGTLALILLIMNIYVIQQTKFLFSLLFLPSLFFLLILILFILNFTFINKKNISIVKKIKFSLVIPLIKPSQFIYLLVLIEFFYIIYLVRTEIVFFVIPCFVSTFFYILKRQYNKKFKELI
ncbi:hypothetical protein [Jeotgalibaca ciconiae]|uniref:DUF624 domain-containing protein n=1 Tax=Jeotgalibaca ciconiae TaxID=2496265 RepID=A0A3Q9BJ47_9LACT|nr:hypothetical protein [Jeotgalibaca ciconiae]AZP03574.1 hypothetical protein EJN90_02190 [Jeotgalibaca ciconiae]